MKQRLALRCAVLGLSASCATKHPAPPKPANASASVAPTIPHLPASGASGGHGCVVSGVTALSEAELTAFVTRWRSAQKARDLTAYSAC